MIDERQDIYIIRGTTEAFEVLVLDENEKPYIMKETDVLRFGVKRNALNSEYDILKEMRYTDEGLEPGVYTFVLNPLDTINLACGTYCYDVGLETVDGCYYNVIECSHFDIKHNVTKGASL